VTRTDRALAAVETLLERQRQALLAGDLASLTHVPDKLAAALRDLDLHPPTAPVLARLQAAASHNARLLVAAHRGIAQARARLDGDRAAALTTYDAMGHKTPAAPGARVLSRR